jgi:sulfite reductase beta subunit
MTKTNIGPINYQLMLPPMIKRNYGKWKTHRIIDTGVIEHVSQSGEPLYTVRAGAPKIISVYGVREICDLADKFCDGYLKFTSRTNIEFLVTQKEKIAPLIAELKRMGLPVGGTGYSFKTIIQCPGWLHCHTAIIDSPGVAKALHDALYDYFFRDDLPAKLKIAIAGCLNMCGAIHCSDIGIIGMHRRPPRVNDEIVTKLCEIPTLIASCPTAAIRPKGKSVEVNPDRCMYCGNCYTVCPGMEIHDPEYDCLSIWVGGKATNARTPPAFSRLAIPYLPNHPPRWPETIKQTKNIVETWLAHAKEGERMGDWIERISWERFFELTGIPFTDKHIDDFIFSVPTFRTTTQFRY